jgi:hypothetical protein
MYDLIVTAHTPGNPTVRVADGVSMQDADALVQRLLAHDLADKVSLVLHDTGPAVDDRNAANLEVLLAVLERRERAAGSSA